MQIIDALKITLDSLQSNPTLAPVGNLSEAVQVLEEFQTTLVELSQKSAEGSSLATRIETFPAETRESAQGLLENMSALVASGAGSELAVGVQFLLGLMPVAVDIAEAINVGQTPDQSFRATEIFTEIFMELVKLDPFQTFEDLILGGCMAIHLVSEAHGGRITPRLYAEAPPPSEPPSSPILRAFEAYDPDSKAIAQHILEESQIIQRQANLSMFGHGVDMMLELLKASESIQGHAKKAKVRGVDVPSTLFYLIRELTKMKPIQTPEELAAAVSMGICNHAMKVLREKSPDIH
jgi:hypothetical protein